MTSGSGRRGSYTKFRDRLREALHGKISMVTLSISTYESRVLNDIT